MCNPLFSWEGLSAQLPNGLVPVFCSLHSCDSVSAILCSVGRAVSTARSGPVSKVCCRPSRGHVQSIARLGKTNCLDPYRPGSNPLLPTVL